MLGMAWLNLRQARAALANGHLEEAQRLLADPAVQGHQKSWALLEKLARGACERAEKRLAQGDAGGAWDDLARAESVAPAGLGGETARLRQSLATHGLTEARNLLEAGEPRRAAEAIGRLRERKINSADYHILEDAAKDWLLAQELADRGEFGLARQMFERVLRAISDGMAVERFRTELERRGIKFTELLPALHDALDQRNWRDVLQLADAVLAGGAAA